MRKIALMALILLALPSFSDSRGRQYRESHYRDIFCSQMGGEAEVRSPSGTRIDCVLDGHAVEVEFGEKWAEGVGQALGYGASLSKTPGLVLIVNPGEERYALRVQGVIDAYHLPLRLWQMDGRTGNFLNPVQK